jgi:hypothetical protein
MRACFGVSSVNGSFFFEKTKISDFWWNFKVS